MLNTSIPRMCAVALFACVLAAISGCETTPAATPRTLSGNQPADLELRDALRQLAKLHNDRNRLALYVSLPFLHHVEPEIRAFTDQMGAQNKAFFDELSAYAAAGQVDLTFEYSDDILSQAQKRLEKMQGDALRSANNDFGLMVIAMMYMDYGFGRSLAASILAQTKDIDPVLKDILDRDVRMHDDGIKQMDKLLDKYQLTP